jgi:hypothetical protein
LHEYYVPLDMSAADLASAAQSWFRNAAEYPERQAARE